jgi:hypothetical protein
MHETPVEPHVSPPEPPVDVMDAETVVDRKRPNLAEHVRGASPSRARLERRSRPVALAAATVVTALLAAAYFVFVQSNEGSNLEGSARSVAARNGTSRAIVSVPASPGPRRR